MKPYIADLSEHELALLTTVNLRAFMFALAQARGAEATQQPWGMYYRNPASVSPLFNGVISNGGSDIDQAITVATDYFTEHKRPMAFWWYDDAAPTDLGARLLAHGWAEYETQAPCMAADLHSLPASVPTPAGFTIEIVRDALGAQTWSDTFNTIYGTPPFGGEAWRDAFTSFGPAHAPFTLYLGRLHGQPVATNMLVCAAGAASLFGVGTLHAARGQGIGAAITLQAYHDARARGYHIGVLFASPAGLPVYQRLGLRKSGTISRYLWRLI